MFANHLKIAFRNITRQKFYSFINILGLAIGLAICLLILLFIKDEISYDQHHSKSNQIYRTLMVWGKNQDGGTRSPINPYKLQPALKIDFPELENITRLAPAYGSLVTYEEENYQEQNWFFADPEIFQVFDYELIKGDKKTCLNDPFTVILSASIAQKYFGSEDPMGKVLRVNDENDVRVTGVFNDITENAHFVTDALISMETGKSVYNQLVLNNWGEGSTYTYLVLPKEKTEAGIEARFPAFIEKNIGEGSSEGIGIDLQKMTDIHLHSNLRGEIQANSDIRYIYISSAIALFILLLACINYMNLATARSVKRAMEIGVRKTLGAPKSTLIRQFLSESILVAVFALVLAFLLAQLALPAFNNFMDKNLVISSMKHLDIIGLFLGITLLVGLIAGSYPAFYLSSFQAIQVFRENFSKGSSAILRKFLVVFQFGISIILILATIVVYQQWNFLQTKEIGMNRENLVMVPIPDLDQYQSLKNQLKANPNILSVGASNKRLTGRLSSNLGFKAEQYEPDPNVRSSIKIVTNDLDFLKTIEVKMDDGRLFSEEFGSDDTSAFILNQAAVNMLGWEEPIGKWFETSEFNAGTWVPRKGNVIGVIQDYNHESLYEAVKPACYFVSKTWLNWISIKINGQNVPETLADIKEKWTQYASEELYEYEFLDDQIAQLYHNEERFFNLFTFFTMLAIFIAGLGIFGLSAFMAEQRTKEIGVRKVFGASTGNIVLLLSKEFTRLVLVGFLIAAPLGWYFMDNWLQDFTYRINIGWLPFVGAGILALALAWFTAGFQSFKAAVSNPIQSLRHE